MAEHKSTCSTAPPSWGFSCPGPCAPAARQLASGCSSGGGVAVLRGATVAAAAIAVGTSASTLADVHMRSGEGHRL
eukprot:1060720-Rhodomonas_salina.2